MSAFTVTLPLPPRSLSSNGSHGHWASKSRDVRDYRDLCRIMALAASNRTTGACIGQAERVRVSYLFGIKGARGTGVYCPRDVTNAIAAFKAGQDGLVDAAVIPDDSALWMELGTVAISNREGPYVRVTIEIAS